MKDLEKFILALLIDETGKIPESTFQSYFYKKYVEPVYLENLRAQQEEILKQQTKRVLF